MIFQILDIDYTLVSEKPIIRIFGKTENGDTVCGFVENFEPYFYISGSNIKESLEGENNVVRVEEVEKYFPLGYQTKKSKFYKVTLKNPAKTPEIRERLKAKGLKVFEADIPFKYRFMADYDLKGMDWVEVEDENGINTNTVKTKKCVKIKNLKRIDKVGTVPLSKMAIDIECVSLKQGEMPDGKKDPIIMISFAFSNSYNGTKDMVISTRAGEGVVYYENEKDMLQAMSDIIMDYDPDVITGYNLNNFDIPYILDRMKYNEIFPNFGRCNKMVRKNQIMNRFKINIIGRVIVDSFEIIKKDFSLKRYDLNTVGHDLLGEEKDPVKKSDIPKYWKGNQKDYELLVSYSRKDSVLALNLLLKLNLLDKYIALANVSGTLLQDILDSGETTKIENLLLREFNKEGFILPCKPDKTEVARRDKLRKIGLTGGYVIEPDKGLHSSVLVLDFKSMYPSLIRTYNMCPTTLILGDDIEGSIHSPTGAKFVNEKIRKGIIPRILNGLMIERGKVKKDMSAANDDSLLRELSAKQFALKIMANAFYGHFGYPRAKVYSLDIANSITSFGRETIKKTKEHVEKSLGYKVVYGDTDSVMVKVPYEELEDLKRVGDQVSDEMTKMLDGIMELEFEKAFKRFLPLSKKRYAAWYFEYKKGEWKEGMLAKGIETVRRDWCDLTSETIQKILDIILKESDVTKAVKYFKKVVQELVDGKIPIEKLVVTKTLTKRPELYANIQPHSELVKRINKRTPAEAPGVGDRIGYVIIKGIELLSKRAEDPNYIIDNGLEIDSKYYIENQLLPPLERIFTALGVSKTELLGKGKQSNIMGIINSINSKPKIIDYVNVKDATGFMCEKCNKIFRLPPLSGTCKCGNGLLFSSSKGPSKNIIME